MSWMDVDIYAPFQLARDQMTMVEDVGSPEPPLCVIWNAETANERERMKAM